MAATENNGRRIPAPIVPDGRNRLVKFSFKYTDLASNDFDLQQCSDVVLRFLVAKIREYSHWPLDAFIDQNNHEHRHIIDFRETRFKDGFTNVNVDQLAYHEAWQFELVPREPWRIYGILVEETFFVIWLDPNHSLYEPISN